MKSPAIFLDRDGTLMEDPGYINDPRLVKLYPEASDALRKLRAAGYRTFIVTNQSGIGRGLITETQYRAVETEFLRQLGADLIDASYYCPDLPGVPSTRRKPEPGMVLEAAAEHGVDLARSYFIGDKCSDIECGKRAGMRTILVLTGEGASQQCNPDFIVAGIADAVHIVLER
ncbi:MAG TPA: HAD family hydrolase [Bryobacteraceae bacterium]|jgi:D-glycero-D-manno-heptose 1,7-bisphosphate phosphatase